jgi:2,3-bisphosphoglycerate-independent phosphoglycerate mutase
MKVLKPVVLVVLDGWGIREMQHGNAIVQAKTPNFDRWLRNYERSILGASGEAVGLEADQMGNSEVGHLNIGAGRVVYQDITRINKAIADGSFYKHPVLIESIEKVKQKGTKLHLLGLLGPGGVHSHTQHLYALLRLAAQHEVQPIIHVITDGRDTPPNSAIQFVQELAKFLEDTPGTIATVSGRYYAMDRDNRWERTKLAYDAIVLRKGRVVVSASQAVSQSYDEGVFDEFIKPTVIHPAEDERLNVETEDCLVFFNFRADRMRQIVKACVVENFADFERLEYIGGLDVLTFTEYEKDFSASVLFPKDNVSSPLGKIISDHQLKQFHAAETEKYPHVTYFLNGGREEPFDGEDRSLVPSPRVATYDLKPEMSAYELTAKIEDRLRTSNDDFVVVNFANLDMVGHTGILEAAIRAVEVVDDCVGRIVGEVINKGGVAIVTADHGNAERMIDEVTGGPHTYHTTGPVPLFVIGNAYFELRPSGILADVAPTILDLMRIPKPSEMTGRSLLMRCR